MQDEYAEFRSKIFIDSNVILQCLPLEQLPWAEINPSGPILILIAPTVLREVDSKKRGRPVGEAGTGFQLPCGANR